MMIRPMSLGAAAALLAASLTACAPGGSGGGSHPSAAQTSAVSTDVAGAGKVTLTVWDQNVDGGIADAQKKLNAQFEAKYPNVTIKRVTRSFSDLKTTLKLALSSNNPPDVIQANQGYPDMGAFVQAGLLQNVNRYAAAYGWDKRFPGQLLDLNRFTSDGRTWHTGDLYGVSQTGEIVGVFYNKKTLSALGIPVPKTLADLDAAMAKVKAAGKLPMQFGDSEKFPGIFLFGTAAANTLGKESLRGLVFSTGGSWTDAKSVQAARTVADWTSKGYLNGSFAGVSQDEGVQNFVKGQGAFLISGTWELQAISKGLGKDAGFTALSADATGDPTAMGGEGLCWSITSKSAHPDVAAAYIDFITGAQASRVMADTGNLPAVPPADWKPAAGTLAADVAAQWEQVSRNDGLVPYLDYTTPTFYDTLSNGMQTLLAHKAGPTSFTGGLQSDYSAFHKTH